jgi:hypothetical protein
MTQTLYAHTNKRKKKKKTPLMVSPDAVGTFIAPCQQKEVTKQTVLPLPLGAVRVTTERGD